MTKPTRASHPNLFRAVRTMLDDPPNLTALFARIDWSLPTGQAHEVPDVNAAEQQLTDLSADELRMVITGDSTFEDDDDYELFSAFMARTHMASLALEAAFEQLGDEL